MDTTVNIAEEVASILDRLRKGTIKPVFAKSELHYIISAARTVEEVNAAYQTYSQMRQKKRG